MTFKMLPDGVRPNWWLIAIIAICLLAFAVWVTYATAKNWDKEELKTEAAKIRSLYLSKAGTLPQFFNGKQQFDESGKPKSIHGNCCGEADAYEADDVFVDEFGTTWAVLTCNDPENCKEIPGKIIRSPGSRWKVMPWIVLMNFNPKNDTGHGWIYISPSATDSDGNPTTLCWAAPSGN